MEPSRDNPLQRFATFWIALGTFLIFALLIGVFWVFNNNEPKSLEDIAATKRYQTKQEVFTAQASVIPEEAISAAIQTFGTQLAASNPAAVEKPEQVVPGSPTAKKLAESGSGDFTAYNEADKANANLPVDPAVMEIGKAQFLVCGACHGQNGEGTMAGPPLANSEWVRGPLSNLVQIQMRGLVGPISVAGKEYTFPAGMTPMAYQTDEQVAAVLTYIRNSFGNKAPPVKADQIAPLRTEVGKPQLNVSELIKPDAK